MDGKCTWIYFKGPRKGQRCTTKIVNRESDRCIKHARNNHHNETEDETQTIISEALPQEEDRNAFNGCQSSSNPSSIGCIDNNVSDGNDILLTKYFVYDCIRQFLKEEKEMNDILFGTKSESKASSSNLSTILTMSAVGCLPLLLKNINLSTIFKDALHQSPITHQSCETTGVLTDGEKKGADTATKC